MKTLDFVLILGLLAGCMETTKEKAVVADPSSDMQLINTKSADDPAGAVLAFENPKYEFGTIDVEKQATLEVNFNFLNKGAQPLVILRADTSCGCLKADFPKEPILQGQNGVVRATVDLKDQHGFFNKTIVVKANTTTEYYILRISGNIH